MTNDNQFVKFRFRSIHGVTAGLVLAVSKYRELSISELSRMFPSWEAGKMHFIDCSDTYPTVEDAIHHTFEKEPK